jgi:hypothetical protein
MADPTATRELQKDDPDEQQAKCDLLGSRRSALTLFALPTAAVLFSGFFDVVPAWRTAIWVAALGTMGVGCAINAARCGRTHCYFTGPFFLVMAIVALLFGIGIVPLGRFGWSTISAIVLIGAVALCCISESLLGKYRRPAA